LALALSRAGREVVLWNRRLRSVPLLPYAVSCGLVGIAIGMRLLLGEALTGVPFITIFPAVVIATFLGGLGPGLLATVLGGACAWFFLFPQIDPAVAGSDPGLAPLVAYALVAGFDCVLIDWLIRGAEHNAALVGRNELLMRELQHRVKNHVQLVSSLLKVQAGRADASARQALLEASRRVQIVASLYRDTYVPDEQVDVARHLQHLCHAAEQSFAATSCKITLTIPPAPIVWSVDRVMPVSLIANELITNAFRHGLAQGPGTITVSLRRLDGNFELCVSDTGGRLPGDFDVAKHAGLGLSIVDGLAREIGGSVRLVDSAHAGFAVTFPA
jgi:two-component system, sensor histidine kinase PdtaS